MQKNICPECGTENEKDYVYCKNCGFLLETNIKDKAEEAKQSNSSGAYSSTQNFNNVPKDFVVDNIDSVPIEEISAFIGQKAYNILPKFSKMVLSGSRVSWCWPAAVLGFIFGPLGLAFWFFYRKMYKPAVLCTVIGAIFQIIVTALTFTSLQALTDSLTELITYEDLEHFMNVMEDTDLYTGVFGIIAENFETAYSIVSAIIGGIFGYHIYMKHCVKKIKKFKSTQFDPRYYQVGLPAVGGTSDGMLALGIIIAVSINFIISFVSIIMTIFI